MAKANFPDCEETVEQYGVVAGQLGQVAGVSGDQVLEDLKAAAMADLDFSEGQHGLPTT